MALLAAKRYNLRMKISQAHLIGLVSLIFFVGAGCRSISSQPLAKNTIPRPVSSCDHPYYPLHEGYRASFSSTFDGRTNQYQMRVLSVKDHRVKLSTTFEDGIEATQDLLCENGSWKAEGYVDLASHLQGQRVRVET